jgi:hypothetical protein
LERVWVSSQVTGKADKTDIKDVLSNSPSLKNLEKQGPSIKSFSTGWRVANPISSVGILQISIPEYLVWGNKKILFHF